MKRTSFLDCHSIGQCLKRVKISTSPGELRLDKDIELLLSGKRWMALSSLDSADNVNHICFVNDRGVRSPSEIFCLNARLTRDPVDPLRLRLTCLYDSPSSPSQSPLSSHLERWIFHIQMPRMYPHVPPTVTRVSRDAVPSNENLGWIGNTNGDDRKASMDSFMRGLRISTAVISSSMMQIYMEPPVPEKILVNDAPPVRADRVSIASQCQDFNIGGDSRAENEFNLFEIDAVTSVYNSWSPISSLGDLMDFLIEIPTRRREWWSIESNRRLHNMQQCLFKKKTFQFNGMTTPQISALVAQHSTNDSAMMLDYEYERVYHRSDGQPLVRPKSPKFSREMMLDSSLEGTRYHSHQLQSSSPIEMDTEDLRQYESMIQDKRDNPFIANRFDVGYERGLNNFH